MMTPEELSQICEDLTVLENDGRVRIALGTVSTGWVSLDDSFFERIHPEKLNPFFLKEHLLKEIEIKNVLDEGIDFLNSERYSRAIDCFDDVLYYDSRYCDALIGKSHALCGQGHFVKALRFFKMSDSHDGDYYKLLLAESSAERDAFPKIKRNIYAGDEAASRGEFEKALGFYERALSDPSKFKNSIFFKLLNKKASAFVKLKRFDEALESFDLSIDVHENDSAYFGRGYCRHELGLDCADSLRHAVLISKRHLLMKADIFNDVNCFDDALKCYDEFLTVHFTLDGDFARAIEGKIVALDGMSLDSSREREIFSQIMDKSY